MPLFDLVKSLVKDDSGKLADPFDFDNGIAAALKRYSKDRPRTVCIDQPGQDSYDIPLPADWCPGFSSVEAIEFPVDQVPEQLIDPRDWRFYLAPAGTVIRFRAVKPTSLQPVRVTYTILHDENSLPPADLEAVAAFAAAHCCGVLARAYGNTSDPIIQADTVNYRSKGDEYARRARDLEGQYKNHLGIKDSDTTPAAMTTAPPPVSDRPWSARRR